MTRSYEPFQERSIFTDPLSELEIQKQREANRPVMNNPSPVDNSAENEAENHRRELAKRAETLRKEQEAAQRKSDADAERMRLWGIARREQSTPEAVEDRQRAERERNAQWVACPVCLQSFKKNAEGKLPKHQKRVPSPEVGAEWVECDPESTSTFISEYQGVQPR